MVDIVLVALTCIVNLSLGLLVLLRNPRKQVSIVFFLISLFVSLWAVSNFLTSAPEVSLLVNSLFNRLAFLTAFLAVAASVWFSAIFPRPATWSRRFITFLVAITCFVGFFSVTNMVAGEVTIQNGGLHFTVGQWVLVYIAVILCFLGIIIVNLVRAYKKSRGQTRQQAAFILLAFSLPIFLGLVTNAIVPTFTSSWQTAAAGPTFTILLVGLISFAIARHHLFDIRLALARSFAYALSIAAIAGLYAAAAFSISNLFLDGSITVEQEIFFAVFSALVALLFQPLKRIFDRITNHLFYRDAYDSQIFLDQFNHALVANTDLRQLLIASSTIIRDNLKAEFCLFGLGDPNSNQPLVLGSDAKTFKAEDIKIGQKFIPHFDTNVIVADDLDPEYSKLRTTLERSNIALMVRLTPNPAKSDATMGYLLLGNKRSGNPYSSQDIKILGILANSLVIALQNAFRFEEIKNFNTTLQQKIEDATHQLRHANEKLRKLDETKDDFIGMASHQLRTPLTSVKGYLSMVLDNDAGPVNKMQRKMLNQSFISAQRMVYLISDLLNVSRLRTGKFVIEPIESDLSVVVEQEMSQLLETAKAKDLHMVYHKPQHFPVVKIDETKIRQVIMNFIDNAVYYTPSGGHIDIYLLDKPESIEFTVVDDGIGVPRSEQHHLFTKFYRARNAKHARPDGTGLGIFMAKKVIIAQGGAVIFKSVEGKGSTFGFTFPKRSLGISIHKA